MLAAGAGPPAPRTGRKAVGGPARTAVGLPPVTPETLAAAVRTCLLEAVEAGELRADVPDRVTVERPRNRDHGDWATNVALQLAKGAGVPPRQFAELLAARLRQVDGVAAVDVAGPGFLNITVDAASAGVLAAPSSRPDAATGTTRRSPATWSTWSSSPPTPPGPLHIGHTRWAALGDALARVLRASGADVTTRVLHQRRRRPDEPLRRRACSPGPPAGRCPRAATPAIHRRPGPAGARRAPGHPRPDRGRGARRRARPPTAQMADIKPTLADFGVDFDVFFSEQDLHDAGRREGRRAAARAGPRRRRAARSGCAPPTSATTRTA